MNLRLLPAFLPRGELLESWNLNHQFQQRRFQKIMNLIRYRVPNSAPWSALDRWSNLRDELNSFFDMPSWSSFDRTSQLFAGWSAALDLYESGDHFEAVVELPGMRKEEIDISLRDGTLTVSGERKRESTNGEKAQRTERYVGAFRRSIAMPTQCGRQ
jgi:HSP20 family protein